MEEEEDIAAAEENSGVFVDDDLEENVLTPLGSLLIIAESGGP